jgi:AbrB family transcriptional regulator (stage V sporulation protein T)
MRLREGEELEIFIDNDNGLIFKKYSAVGELKDIASEYADIIFNMTGHTTIITDKDRVVAVSGDKRSGYLDRTILNRFERMLGSRTGVTLSGADCVSICGEDHKEYTAQAITPIISRGDVNGAICMVSKKSAISESDIKVMNSAALFISMQF